MIPITFNGIHRYYLVKELGGGHGCNGCYFEDKPETPCGDLVRPLPEEHRCGNFPGIYIATDEKSVAAYVTRRME